MAGSTMGPLRVSGWVSATAKSAGGKRSEFGCEWDRVSSDVLKNCGRAISTSHPLWSETDADDACRARRGDGFDKGLVDPGLILSAWSLSAGGIVPQGSGGGESLGADVATVELEVIPEAREEVEGSEEPIPRRPSLGLPVSGSGSLASLASLASLMPPPRWAVAVLERLSEGASYDDLGEALSPGRRRGQANLADACETPGEMRQFVGPL